MDWRKGQPEVSPDKTRDGNVAKQKRRRENATNHITSTHDTQQ